MRDLYKLTASEALSFAVEKVMGQNEGMKISEARTLVYNAVIYNCVIEEIVGQVDFLMEKEE